MIPGELSCEGGDIELLPGRDLVSLQVSNIGDRPIQVGSHYHFAEANASLSFDREVAWGRRLAIPAGTAVRFEPGIDREVELVALAGARRVLGLRGLVAGSLDNRDNQEDRDDQATNATAAPVESSPSSSADGRDER